MSDCNLLCIQESKNHQTLIPFVVVVVVMHTSDFHTVTVLLSLSLPPSLSHWDQFEA